MTVTPALLAIVVAASGVAACHTIREEEPTLPSATPAPLIPIAPIGAAPQPTPRPTPGAPGSPPPDEEPLPATPVGGSCSDPRPPAVSRMDVVIHIYGANRLILDATPLVGPNDAYCKLIGFTDGRRFCPTRPEGHPERFACDAMVVGNAADTGRAGPTWRANGGPCVFANGCENHSDNQFLAFAYVSGTYQACAASGVCGTLDVTQ
jgi:hypothetical protein